MKTENVRKIMKELKNSEIELESGEIRELAVKLREDETDFELGDYRFIHENQIDEIMVKELENDSYILGCFKDCFLADICGLPVEIIKIVQKAERYESLGGWLIDKGYVEKISKKYAEADGYGHHFAGYDFVTHEIGCFYGFRLN